MIGKYDENDVHVVLAHRWGDDNEHTYFVSCRKCPLVAFADSLCEKDYRGGKYECSIFRYNLNQKNDGFNFRNCEIISQP